MWQKSRRKKSSVLTTALDALSFWLYNTFIQTGAQDEDYDQTTQAGQGTHCPVL